MYPKAYITVSNLFFFLIIFYGYECLSCVLHACLVPAGPEEGVGSPETGVTGSSERPSNLNPREKHIFIVHNAG